MKTGAARRTVAVTAVPGAVAFPVPPEPFGVRLRQL
jgi:hypothetical protein